MASLPKVGGAELLEPADRGRHGLPTGPLPLHRRSELGGHRGGRSRASSRGSRTRSSTAPPTSPRGRSSPTTTPAGSRCSGTFRLTGKADDLTVRMTDAEIKVHFRWSAAGSNGPSCRGSRSMRRARKRLSPPFSKANSRRSNHCLSGSRPRTLDGAMAYWMSIEVFDGPFSARAWQENVGDSLVETALRTGATDWNWHSHTWGVVFEVCFEVESDWDRFRQTLAVQIALDAVPDPGLRTDRLPGPRRLGGLGFAPQARAARRFRRRRVAGASSPRRCRRRDLYRAVRRRRPRTSPARRLALSSLPAFCRSRSSAAPAACPGRR